MAVKKYEARKALIRLNGRDKYLAVRRHESDGGHYEVPGGRKNHESESDSEVLNREVYEETGLKVKIIRMLNAWSLDLPHVNMHLDGITYLCGSDSNQVTLAEEHDLYKWVTLDEFKKLNIQPWLRDALDKL